MSAGKELKLTPEQIANWFGNRGYDLFSYEQTDRPLTYKAVTKNGENQPVDCISQPSVQALGLLMQSSMKPKKEQKNGEEN